MSIFRGIGDFADAASRTVDVIPADVIPVGGTIVSEFGAVGLNVASEMAYGADDLLNLRLWNLCVRPFTAIAETGMVAVPWFEYADEVSGAVFGQRLSTLPSDMFLSKPEAPNP